MGLIFCTKTRTNWDIQVRVRMIFAEVLINMR